MNHFLDNNINNGLKNSTNETVWNVKNGTLIYNCIGKYNELVQPGELFFPIFFPFCMKCICGINGFPLVETCFTHTCTDFDCKNISYKYNTCCSNYCFKSQFLFFILYYLELQVKKHFKPPTHFVSSKLFSSIFFVLFLFCVMYILLKMLSIYNNQETSQNNSILNKFLI